MLSPHQPGGTAREQCQRGRGKESHLVVEVISSLPIQSQPKACFTNPIRTFQDNQIDTHLMTPLVNLTSKHMCLQT